MFLKINQPAPDFSLPSTNGEVFCLSQTQKNKPCILYFYPKDFTPGCTKEACQFNDSMGYFKDLDIDVYGISTDNIDSHIKFKEKYRLSFDLLADTDGKVTKLYKATIPLVNISNRISYLLNKEHKISSVYRNFFAAGNHLRRMVDAVRSL